MGTIVPMSKVEGRFLLLSGLCKTTLTYMYHDNVHVLYIVIHMRMRITGRFKGYFLSLHMANFVSHRMKVVSSLAVCSQDFRDK